MSTLFDEKVGAIAQLLGRYVTVSDSKTAMTGRFVKLEYVITRGIESVLVVLDYGYAMPVSVGLTVREGD
jgi:hypothetical protein